MITLQSDSRKPFPRWAAFLIAFEWTLAWFGIPLYIVSVIG